MSDPFHAEFVWAMGDDERSALSAEGWEECGQHQFYPESVLMMRRIREATRQGSLLDQGGDAA